MSGGVLQLDSGIKARFTNTWQLHIDSATSTLVPTQHVAGCVCYSYMLSVHMYLDRNLVLRPYGKALQHMCMSDVHIAFVGEALGERQTQSRACVILAEAFYHKNDCRFRRSTVLSQVGFTRLHI